MPVPEKIRHIKLRLSDDHPCSEIIHFDGTETLFSLSCEHLAFPTLTVQLTGKHKIGLLPFTISDNGSEFPVEDFHELKLFHIDARLPNPVDLTINIW